MNFDPNMLSALMSMMGASPGSGGGGFKQNAGGFAPAGGENASGSAPGGNVGREDPDSVKPGMRKVYCGFGQYKYVEDERNGPTVRTAGYNGGDAANRGDKPESDGKNSKENYTGGASEAASGNGAGNAFNFQSIMPLLNMLGSLKGQNASPLGFDPRSAAGGAQNPLGGLMGMMSMLGGLNGGGGNGGILSMLPLIMAMTNGKSPFGNPGAPTAGESAKAGEKEPPAAEPSPEPPPEPKSGGVRPPRLSPFGGIGFAGAEVRGFMERLWRVKRRY